MNKMVECVAKALYESDPDTDDEGHAIPWESLVPRDEACINAAEIAVRALRDLFVGMIDAALT